MTICSYCIFKRCVLPTWFVSDHLCNEIVLICLLCFNLVWFGFPSCLLSRCFFVFTCICFCWFLSFVDALRCSSLDFIVSVFFRKFHTFKLCVWFSVFILCHLLLQAFWLFKYFRLPTKQSNYVWNRSAATWAYFTHTDIILSFRSGNVFKCGIRVYFYSSGYMCFFNQPWNNTKCTCI